MKKDLRLEIMRIIASIFVIVVHVSNLYCRTFPNLSSTSYIISVIFNTLSRVSVPIFFMISGTVIMEKPFIKQKYLSRIKKLILTTVIWTVIYIFIFKYFDQKTLINCFFNPIRGHFWFMYAIIGIYIASPFISKMVLNMNKQEEDLFIKLWLLLSGITYLIRITIALLGLNVEIKYPTPIFNATYYLGYFITGYIIYKRVNSGMISKHINKKIIIYIILSAMTIITCTCIVSFTKNIHYEKMLGYSNIFNMILSISTYIYLLLNIKSPKKDNIITKITPYILGIYLVHVIFIDKIIVNIDITKVNAIIGIPIITIFLYIISYITLYIMKKIPIIKKYIS